MENSRISFNHMNNSISINDISIPFNHYPEYYKYYQIDHYFPPIAFLPEESKIDKAFKIITKLVEKKIIKELTLKELIELTQTISEILQ